MVTLCDEQRRLERIDKTLGAAFRTVCAYLCSLRGTSGSEGRATQCEDVPHVRGDRFCDHCDGRGGRLSSDVARRRRLRALVPRGLECCLRAEVLDLTRAKEKWLAETYPWCIREDLRERADLTRCSQTRGGERRIRRRAGAFGAHADGSRHREGALYA